MEAVLVVDQNRKIAADLVVKNADEGGSQGLVRRLTEFVGVCNFDAHGLCDHLGGRHIAFFRLEPQCVGGESDVAAHLVDVGLEGARRATDLQGSRLTFEHDNAHRRRLVQVLVGFKYDFFDLVSPRGQTIPQHF